MKPNIFLFFADITLNQEFNSWELKNLESGTVHQVQISAFTSAGEGVRSAASFFKTHYDGQTNTLSLQQNLV